jgi:hypothetical protein
MKKLLDRDEKRRCYITNFEIIGNGTQWAKLAGEVYDHPSFVNGERVVTSPILSLDIRSNLAETIHTVYFLGRPKAPVKGGNC